MNYNKILLFVILFSLCLSFTPYIETAKADSYNVELDASFYSYLDGDGSGTWHNYTFPMKLSDAEGASNRYRGVIEWDISSIPDTATITNIGIIYTISMHSSYSATEFCIYPMDYRPSDAYFGNVYYDANNPFGGRYHASTYGIGSNNEFNLSTVDGRLMDYQDIRPDVEDNLTRDWFALGFGLYCTEGGSPYPTDYVYIYRNTPGYRARLWIEYTVNAPDLSNPDPYDGETSVNIPSVDTSIDYEHLIGGATSDLYWYFYDTDNSSWYQYATQNVNSNNTYTQTLSNATEHSITYQWKVCALDNGGNWTNTSAYSFTTEAPGIPTNISCHRINDTSLNISFTKGTFADNTFIIYQKGDPPDDDDFNNWTVMWPAFGGFYLDYYNTTESYAVINNLDNNSCYGFMLFSWTESGSGTWEYSTYVLQEDCCVFDSNYNLYIRYENTTYVDDGDGAVEDDEFFNNLIDLTLFPCSLHTLEVTFDDYTRKQYYIDPGDFTSYPIVLNFTKSPLFFELWWNASVNSSCNCSNITCSYKRMLLAEPIEDSSNLTFYFTVDKQVYLDKNCTGTQVTTINDNLARYVYKFTDESNIFKSRPVYDSYVTFYSSNATQNLVIYQEYFNAKMLIDDVVLLYNTQYFLGVNCSTISDDRYSNIDQVITDDYVSPFVNPVTIPFISPGITEVSDNFEFIVSWYPDADATGMYVYFLDDTNSIILLNCTIMEFESGDIVYTKEESVSLYNFTFPTANKLNTYLVHLKATHKTYGLLPTYNYLLGPNISSVVNHTDIEDLLEDLLGVLPSKIGDPGQRIQWINVILFIIALIPLSILGAVKPGLASIGVGIWLVGAFFMFSLSVSLVGIGTFLMFMGIYYMFKGGDAR